MYSGIANFGGHGSTFLAWKSNNLQGGVIYIALYFITEQFIRELIDTQYRRASGNNTLHSTSLYLAKN